MPQAPNARRAMCRRAVAALALFFPGAAPTITFDTPRQVAAAVSALVAWRTQGVLWAAPLA